MSPKCNMSSENQNFGKLLETKNWVLKHNYVTCLYICLYLVACEWENLLDSYDKINNIYSILLNECMKCKIMISEKNFLWWLLGVHA